MLYAIVVGLALLVSADMAHSTYKYTQIAINPALGGAVYPRSMTVYRLISKFSRKTRTN